jgi:hypothetical protein
MSSASPIIPRGGPRNLEFIAIIHKSYLAFYVAGRGLKR